MLTKADFRHLRDLRDKKHREASGFFVVENPKVLTELLAAGHPFETLYATPRWTPPPGVPVTPLSEADLARITHLPTPTGVFALARLRRPSLDPADLASGLTLALDGVQDPGNVGTLLRIADWYGLARVLLSPDCADLFSQKVVNASMGSFARVPTHVADLPPLLAAAPVPVLGCDLDGDDVRQGPAPRDAILVIGSEGQGLSPAVRATLTRRLTIPRLGPAESLNAAVAAAIICDNLRRLAP